MFIVILKKNFISRNKTPNLLSIFRTLPKAHSLCFRQMVKSKLPRSGQFAFLIHPGSGKPKDREGQPADHRTNDGHRQSPDKHVAKEFRLVRIGRAIRDEDRASGGQGAQVHYKAADDDG